MWNVDSFILDSFPRDFDETLHACYHRVLGIGKQAHLFVREILELDCVIP